MAEWNTLKRCGESAYLDCIDEEEWQRLSEPYASKTQVIKGKKGYSPHQWYRVLARPTAFWPRLN